MIYSAYFDNEGMKSNSIIYECPKCKSNFTKRQVRNTWKCRNCDDEYIRITGIIKGEKKTVIRKFPSEISEGDLVILPIDENNNGREITKVEVVGPSKAKKSRYFLGIKEYAYVVIEGGTWFACIQI